MSVSLSQVQKILWCMFVVVDFIKENVTDLIPKSWLASENTCYWPPSTIFKRYEVPALIRKQFSPSQSWELCPIKILAEAGTFQEGRKKLKKKCSDSEAILTTDTEERGRGKRKRKRAIRFESSDSSSDEEGTEPSQSLLKSLPHQELFNSPPAALVNNGLSRVINPLRASPQSSIPAEGTSGITYYLETENHQYTQAAGQGQNGSNGANRCSCEKSKLFDAAISAFIQNQKLIETEIQSLRNALVKFMSKPAVDNATESRPQTAPDFGPFPLTKEEDLQNLETALRNEQRRKCFVLKLRSFGGHMFSDHTRRVLKYLMTDELAEGYSWLGFKHKTVSSLIMCTAIIDAVCEEHRQTRTVVEDVIKTWLRHAKERHCYVKKNLRTQ